MHNAMVGWLKDKAMDGFDTMEAVKNVIRVVLARLNSISIMPCTNRIFTTGQGEEIAEVSFWGYTVSFDREYTHNYISTFEYTYARFTLIIEQ